MNELKGLTERLDKVNFSNKEYFSLKCQIAKMVVKTITPYLIKKLGKELGKRKKEFEDYLTGAITSFLAPQPQKSHVHANFSEDRETLTKSISDLMKDIKQIKLEDLNVEELKLLESNLKDFLDTVV